MSNLPGYDSWLIREPEQPRYEPRISYWLIEYSPHAAKPIEEGPFDSHEEAEASGRAWLDRIAASDPRFAEDYDYEIIERGEMADCTCTDRRMDEWCSIHGRDPDQAYEEFRERK